MIAAYHGVPVVFYLETRCSVRTVKLVPNIETVAVKSGVGGATFNIHPERACELIRKGVKKALQNIDQCKIEAPKNPKLEIRFSQHEDAHKAKHYPGAKLVDAHTVEYQAKDVLDMITARMFIL